MGNSCVAYIVDDNDDFNKMLEMSIRSLIKFNSNINDIFVLTIKNNKHISVLTDISNAVHVIYCDDLYEQYFKDVSLGRRTEISNIVYFKLLLPYIRPLTSYDRIIYLDCDYEVIGDIKYMMEMPFHSAYIMGSPGNPKTFDEIVKTKEDVIANKTKYYINANELIFNTRFFQNIDKDFYISNYLKLISYGFFNKEQDCMNLMSNIIQVYPHSIKHHTKAIYSYDIDMSQLDLSNISIIHYACGSKKLFLDKYNQYKSSECKCKKCISLSLYGHRMWYYLPLLFNMDCINKSKLDYDIVIRTTQDCKELLEKIMEQENIKFNNKLIFEIMPRDSEYSRGMFWRYHELYLDRYEHVAILDIDSIYTYELYWVMDDLFKSNKKIGSFKHLSCNGGSVDGGQIFFNTKILDSEFKQRFKRICDYVDSQDIVNYSADQDILNEILTPYMKSGEFRLYDAMRHKHWIKYNDLKRIEAMEKKHKDIFVDCVSLAEFDFPNLIFQKGWYFNDFYKSLKYYDFDNKTYSIDGVIYKVERDYSSSRTNNALAENEDLVKRIASI